MISNGFRMLLRREILRFIRRPGNTFMPPFITNILYFSVFGVILGDRIQGFEVSYVLFILPGLVTLGAVSNSFENSSFSIFHGRWDKYIENIVASPLSHTEVALAYILSSALRGILVGVMIGIIGLFFAAVTIANFFYLISFILVITVLFSSFGVIGGLFAREYEHITVMNQFLLQPLVFFGGVFYSIDTLPPLLRSLSLLNPMVYMVNGVRYGFLGGNVDVRPDISLIILGILTIAVLVLDIYLFKKGHGIAD